MPKMKTNSAASKRARITGSGKVMQAGSAMRHDLEHKSARKRRALSADAVLRGGQAKKLTSCCRSELRAYRNKQDFRKLRNRLWHVSSAQ